VTDKATGSATAGTARSRAACLMGISIPVLLLALRRRHGRRGGWGDDAGVPRRVGSLMRHFFAPSPIVGLAGRMVDPPPPAPLIPPAGGLEGRAPRAMGAGPRAVAIAPITHAAEEEELVTVRAGAEHQTERVHGSLRATRKGVDTREDLCELRAAGRAGSRPRGLARGPGGIEPPGPHPLGALVGYRLPHFSRPRQPASLPLSRPLSRIRRLPVIDDRRGPRRVPVVTGTASASLDQAALTAIIFRVVTCGAGILTSSIPFACFASTWATSTPSGSSKLRWNAPYASSRTK
jgi:hypothetical protein